MGCGVSKVVQETPIPTPIKVRSEPITDPYTSYMHHVIQAQDIKDKIIKELIKHSYEDATGFDDVLWRDLTLDYAIHMKKLALTYERHLDPI